MRWIIESANIQTERAIVFVHGLNGSADTWRGKSHRFIDVLKTELDISEKFGLYIFEYPTKIAELTRLKKLLSLIPGRKAKEFNVGIRRIAMQLKSHLTEILRGTNTIILVAHSMGGLVSKRALVEMSDVDRQRIKLFLSLSVPHNGAPLANLGSVLMGSNPQLVDLKAFSDFTSDLTNRFSNLTNKPKMIYQAGSQDEVVPEGCAMPGVRAEERIDTGDTHYSVLEIADKRTHLPFLRLIRELRALLKLEAQQSACQKANDEVTFEVPENWSFQNVAAELAATANCTIELIGFEGPELATRLKPQQLTASNTFRALEKLRFIGTALIPEYQLKIVDCHFQLIKTSP